MAGTHRHRHGLPVYNRQECPFLVTSGMPLLMAYLYHYVSLLLVQDHEHEKTPPASIEYTKLKMTGGTGGYGIKMDLSVVAGSLLTWWGHKSGKWSEYFRQYIMRE